jgi:WD40 repeat protein
VAVYDGERLVVADVSDGRVRSFTTPGVSSVALSGRSIGVLRYKDFLEVWDFDAGRRLRTIPVSQMSGLQVPVVDFEGTLIAFMRKNGLVDLVDVDSSEVWGSLPTSAGVYARLSGFGFSADGRRLVVVTEPWEKGETRVWAVSRDQWLASACDTAGRDLHPEE